MSNVIALAPYVAARVALDEAAPRARLRAAIQELMAAAEAVYPDITEWKGCADDVGAHSTLPVALYAVRPAKPIQWDGPGIYEFECPAPKRWNIKTCRPTAFLDRAPERDSPLTGQWFMSLDWFKGKFQAGKPRYYAGRDLVIFKKLEAIPAE